MRIATAILLITIHLFNMGGYRLLFDKLESRATVQLVDKLDRQEYNDAELIQLKVPLPMPYQTSWSGFERYDGEIEVNGVHYNYVKRKVENDTLVLLCIPNTGKMKLNSAKEQFFSLVNDVAQKSDHPAPAPKSSAVKSIASEYQPADAFESIARPAANLREYTIIPTQIPASNQPETPYQPPRA